MRLWSKNQEINFFKYAKNKTSRVQLFHKTLNDEYISYPTKAVNVVSNLHIRDVLFNDFSKNWLEDILINLVGDFEVVKNAEIPSIGISAKNQADLVISTSNSKVLSPKDVKAIFILKLSVVWNWKYNISSGSVEEIGDYRTHLGKPSFTSSANILNAVDSCFKIRFSSKKAADIPLIVIGNTPMSNGFCRRADYLKSFGVIQGFWSLNPFPLQKPTRKTSKNRGFYRFDNSDELKNSLNQLLNTDLKFISAMKSKKELSEIIDLVNLENTGENKLSKFISLINH